MALNRKYAGLPDLDTAPDVYETPELTDDISTVPTTTVRSQSEDEDDEVAGISRSRLRIDQARSLFSPANVDARGVDFSDRVDSKRKSYKVSSRARELPDGTEVFGDYSDSEDSDENIGRRVARLKRELEELKDELSQPGQESAHTTNIDSLSSLLDEVSATAEVVPHRPTSRVPQDGEGGAVGDGNASEYHSGNATYTITYSPSYKQSHALAKAADFDRRLVLLEKAIGIGSSLPELEADGLPRAVIPTLDMLRKQISTLSEASTTSLDTLARKARDLTREADQLTKARQSAKNAQEALDGGQKPGDDPPSEASEQTAKINALYGILPTIENLAPLVPPLMDRLRSLRAIHSEAATAGQTLERIEARQRGMAEDIKLWRDGLEKVEMVMNQNTATIDGNKQVIEGWVKELEERMAEL